jgi:hypothetical protein
MSESLSILSFSISTILCHLLRSFFASFSVFSVKNSASFFANFSVGVFFIYSPFIQFSLLMLNIAPPFLILSIEKSLTSSSVEKISSSVPSLPCGDHPRRARKLTIASAR